MTTSKQTSVLILLAASLLTGSLRASADTTNLVPVADTIIRSTTPESNYGGLNYMPIGVSSSPFSPPYNRGLLKFDLTGIPTNAVVTAVNLRLIVVSTANGAANFDLSRMLQSWGEGTNATIPNIGGAPAVIGDACWESRLRGIADWGAVGGLAGADFVSDPSVTNLMGSATNDFSSPGMIADVQMWVLDGSTNFGWILKATGEAMGTGRQIGSREDANHAPILTIDYTVPVPPPATPPALFGASISGGQFSFSFNAESNRTYTVESRDSLAIGSWNLLTNIPAQISDTVITITNPISTDQSFFRAWTP